MDKEKMLQGLEGMLKGLPPEEQRKIIELYEDLIQAAKDNGKDETEIIKKVMVDRDFLEEGDKKGKKDNLSRLIFAGISLFLFNCIFVVGPVAAIAGVYLSLVVTSICLVLAPIAILVTPFFIDFETLQLQLFVSLTLCCIGILLGIAMYYAGKVLYRVLIKYCKWNIKLIKGEF